MKTDNLLDSLTNFMFSFLGFFFDAIGCVNWLKCFIVTKVPARSHLSQFGSLHFVTN